jgi:putative tricarboxylic transport membrane protein
VKMEMRDLSLRQAFLGLACVSAVLSIIYIATSFDYPKGTAAQPGPGFYPLLVGIMWLLSSVAVGLEARAKNKVDKVELPQGAGFWRLTTIIGALLFYIILLDVLGHVIVGAVLILLVLQAMGGLRWPLRIALAVLLTIGSYYLFDVLFDVPLPRGIFFG